MLSKAALAVNLTELHCWNGRGEGGVVGATSCRLNRDYSRWCSALTYTRKAAIPGVVPGGVAPQPIPGRQLYQGWRQMLILVYTSHRSCLYQSLILVYIIRSLVTPVASWWRVLLEPVDSSGAVPAALAGRAWAWSTRLRGSWLGFSFCLAGVRDIQHRGWPWSPVKSGCFRKGGVYL